MSDLSREAQRQSRHDAATKIKYRRTSSRMLLDWLWARSGKTKFIFVGFVLISGAVLVGYVLELAGLRTPRVVEVRRDCKAPGMTIDERATCILAKEAADKKREADEKALQERKRAEEAKARAQYVEATKVATQRKLAAWRAEFESRIDKLSEGNKFLPAAETYEFRQTTLALVIDIMAATEGHPAQSTLQSMKYDLHSKPSDIAFRMEPYFKSDPIARRETEDLCIDRMINRTLGWRAKCGASLKKHVLNLSLRNTYSYLGALINSDTN